MLSQFAESDYIIGSLAYQTLVSQALHLIPPLPPLRISNASSLTLARRWQDSLFTAHKMGHEYGT